MKLTRREMDLSSDRPSVDADLKARIRMAKGCRGIHSICTNVATGLAEPGDGHLCPASSVVSTTARPMGMNLVLIEMDLSDCSIHATRVWQCSFEVPRKGLILATSHEARGATETPVNKS